MDPIAYLTVELKYRDLDSRILIAGHLLQAGYAVVVGQQWSLFRNINMFPAGLALFKTVNQAQAKFMNQYHQAGHFVAATDEEVLNFIDDAGHTLGVSELAAQHCDLFLAQTDAHKTSLEKKFPILKRKIRVVGSPRIDDLNPKSRGAIQQKADALVQEYGRYILFNTNFSTVNSIWGDKVTDTAEKTGDLKPDDAASQQTYASLVEWERKNRNELVSLIHWAGDKFKTHKIVIRPHPGESLEYWREEIKSISNAVLIERSDPHPWILGCEIVAHTGCTTGLEAALVDKQAINIMPSDHPICDRIVNWINPTFKNWTDAAAALEQFINSKTGPIVEGEAARKVLLGKHFPGYRSGSSARLIASNLANMLKAAGAKPKRDYKLNFRPPGFVHITRPDPMMQKFTITMEEFKDKVSSSFQRSKIAVNISMTELTDSLFLLVPR